MSALSSRVEFEAPGWFGKLVLLGDFAHRRLPHHFVNTCDRWLSDGIAASRRQLGGQWLDTYLSGPVWRFAWAEGVLDTRWWFGVMMPSVDAVGRYFPLVVAFARQAPPISAADLSTLDHWYGQAGAAALGTLLPGATLESFEAELLRCTMTEDGPTPAAAGVHTAPSQGPERFVLAGADSLSAWAQVLTAPPFFRRYAGHSFWWPMQVQNDDNSMTVVPGLPDPTQFTSMLEGRW